MRKIVLSIFVLVVSSTINIFAANIRVGLVDQCSNSDSPVKASYINFVKGSGFEPVVLAYTDNKDKILEMVSSCDAIVLCGGEDVDSARYGEKSSDKLGKVNKKRDVWE
jgi:putative glutamine amidotransferase